MASDDTESESHFSEQLPRNISPEMHDVTGPDDRTFSLSKPVKKIRHIHGFFVCLFVFL